ncbi:hypothetical protein ACHWQZ_G009207 [Mnemiopsis leidyi]
MRATLLLLVLLALTCCVADKDVRIVTINQLDSGRTGPPYDLDISVSGLDDGATLLDAMNKAQDQGLMTYSGIDYGPPLGMYITTIDGVVRSQQDHEYWQILGGPDMKSLDLGVSSYVPSNSETVLFRSLTFSCGTEKEEAREDL